MQKIYIGCTLWLILSLGTCYFGNIKFPLWFWFLPFFGYVVGKFLGSIVVKLIKG